MPWKWPCLSKLMNWRTYFQTLIDWLTHLFCLSLSRSVSLLAETFYLTLTLKVGRFIKIEVVEKLVEWLTLRRYLILAFWENQALTLAIQITICIKWGRFPQIHFLRSNYVYTNTRTGILFDKGNLPIWSASKHVQEATQNYLHDRMYAYIVIFSEGRQELITVTKNMQDVYFVFYVINQPCRLLRLSSVRWWLMK